ncbi:hypothetical protein B0T17DRAFT_614137 [Bombardia bombarda]|uniref:Zn(2)-C6 fungal-type domain-containing protein n=1 Tax=Bombardia bombarda TaxID=252184 RepID=A0AA39X6G9_9PEZI|nr:hypothetical protein B0T17DRAFT_614137 [Bombardia bombarda]
MDSHDNQQGPSVPRARITNACEACRVAKVKCQSSSQRNICKRCLESKRECIFKTGPRTRRPRQSKLPPPPGPSKTFTIDIPMPGDTDVCSSLEALRMGHEGYIDDLVPEDQFTSDDDNDGIYYDYDYDQQWPSASASASTSMDGGGSGGTTTNSGRRGGPASVASHTSSLPVGASALSTPPSSAAMFNDASSSAAGAGASGKAAATGQQQRTTRTVASFGLQPQFNLDSAASLLGTFRTVMLEHFPCAVVGEHETVASLAQDRPFVLLALLAAASSSRTLQGHSLYDEEFRKILGLKFVAGGERSLELLQGLVVYVAWYPFHLRPKNKQAFQYIRMTVDIVNDLELDQDPGLDDDLEDAMMPTPERLGDIRTYLSSYYLVSSFASTWNRTPQLQYTEYTAKCCDILERYSQTKGDVILAWQARLQRIVEEASDMRRNQRGHSQSEYQIGLMLKGMEAQLVEWEGRLALDVASATSVRIAILFTRIFLSGAPLLKLPSTKLPRIDAASSFRADPQRLLSLIPALQAAYDYFLSLPAPEINAFSCVEWGNFILVTILGFRLSFPIAVCPEWDDKAARRLLRFGEHLDLLCGTWGGVTASPADDDNDGDNGGTRGRGGGGGGVLPASSQKNTDVLGASKVVLSVVRKKYRKRVARLEPSLPRPQPPPPLQQQKQQQRQEAMFAAAHPGLNASAAGMRLDSTMQGCPMMDGSMEPYYPYWDETFTTGLDAGQHQQGQHQQHQQHPNATVERGDHSSGAAGVAAGGDGIEEPTATTTAYNDLWATMTMGWAHTDIDFGAM